MNKKYFIELSMYTAEIALTKQLKAIQFFL